LAPLAFVGLGLIGLLCCARRFQCDLKVEQAGQAKSSYEAERQES
jgi:hypothetical protein